MAGLRFAKLQSRPMEFLDFTSVCRALSCWVGMPNGRFSGLPRLGIHVRRSGVALLSSRRV